MELFFFLSTATILNCDGKLNVTSTWRFLFFF
uniref:Uncharacterized protein n=1 Tax=Rhizophora mucronata TaxID=61149 RepID=A0A2P2R2T6_RHIMU